jgi:hypothetical protein
MTSLLGCRDRHVAHAPIENQSRRGGISHGLWIRPSNVIIGEMKESELKRLTTKALCASLFVSAALPVRAELPDACWAFTPDAEMVRQTLYMPIENVSHELKVPVIYFEDRFDRVDGAVYEGQLFRVMNESFEPVTRPQTAVLIRENNRAYMTFVIDDKVPLEQVLGIIAGELDRKVGRDLALFDEADAEFGLSKLTPTRWRENPADVRTDRELYVGREIGGAVSAVIACDRTDDPKRQPSYNHDFRAHGIDVRPSYRTPYQKDWQRIQDDISDFIGCALTAATQ